MPFCEECAKYFTPNALTPTGDCPRCGRRLDDGEPIDEPTPWHFKLLVVLTVIYLVWRFVDMFV